MINKPDVSFSHRSEESYEINRVIVIGKSGFVGSELLLSLATIDIEAVGIGVYHVKDGQLVKGEAEKRHTVDYSNWHAGNVNPEDLKKHKELLDR